MIRASSGLCKRVLTVCFIHSLVILIMTNTKMLHIGNRWTATFLKGRYDLC